MSAAPNRPEVSTMSFFHRHSTLSTLLIALAGGMTGLSACKDDAGSPTPTDTARPADAVVDAPRDAGTTADVPPSTTDTSTATDTTVRTDTGDAGASDTASDAAPPFAPVACTGVTD